VQGVQADGFNGDQPIDQLGKGFAHRKYVVGRAQVPRTCGQFLPVDGDEVVVTAVQKSWKLRLICTHINYLRICININTTKRS